MAELTKVIQTSDIPVGPCIPDENGICVVVDPHDGSK